MNCRSAKDWLRSRPDAPLAPAAERTLQDHLTECMDCAGYAREMRMLASLASALPLAEPSESFDWRLRLAISKAEREADVASAPARPRFAPHILEFAAAAAVAAVVVLVAGTRLLPDLAPRPGVASVPRHAAVPADGVGRVIPTSDGAPIGPRPALSYSYFMQPQAPAPDVVRDSLATVRTDDAP